MSDLINVEVSQSGNGQQINVEVSQNDNEVILNAVTQVQLILNEMQQLIANNPAVNQNNVVSWRKFGNAIPGTVDISTAEVAAWLNAYPASFVVNELQSVVVYEFERVVNNINKKFIFFFKRGKGYWGKANGAVTDITKWFYASSFEALPPMAITIDDILQDPNAVIVNIDPVVDGDYITKANQLVWDFTTSGEIQTDGNPKAFYLTYTFDNGEGESLYFMKFNGPAGNYGSGITPLIDSYFVPASNSGITVVPNIDEVLTAGGVSGKKIKLTDVGGSLIEYSGKKMSYRKGAFSTQVGFEDPTATIQLTIPAKPANDTFAMVSDINGLTIEANQAAAELYLKDSAGNILATINVGFLNNEGTTFYYNSSSGMLELKDDEGNVLSSVPVSAFVSNLIQSVEFNGSTPYVLEFKDAENNVVDSVTFTVSNIQGLQALLDSKFDNPDGTTAQYIRGNGSLSLFATDVRGTTLTTLSIPTGYNAITSADTLIEAIAKAQAQLNNALNIKLIIPGSIDLNTYVETGIYNQTLNTQAASGSNYPTPLAGTLEVVRISSTLICQRYHVVGGGVSADNVIYTRIYASGAWGAWKRLITSLDTNVANWDAVYADRVNYLRNQADGNVGAYLGNSASSIADVNNLITGMAWLIGSTLNLPNASSHHVVSFGGSSSYQSQLALRGGNFYFRSKEASVWQAWKRLWHDGDFTSTNVANWNSAYVWGDFRTYGHGTGVTNNPLVSADVLEFNTTGVFRVASSAPSLPVAENGYLYRIYRSASTRYILFYSDSGRVYKNVMNSSTWSGWEYFWDSGDFTSSDVANWNAYANNKADLVDGKVPASQLPSYVDDVLEFANLAAFPASGESGKLYVAIDTNLVYRWSGSAYVVTSSSLALGETSVTAYRGDRGKTAYDHSQTTGNPHNTTISDITGLQAAIDSAVDTVKRPYRSYTALITQTGTNVPSVIILENNLGFTPTWTYVSTGVYRLNSVGNFPDERCIIFSNIGLPYSASNSYEIRWSRTTSPDYLQINTVEKSGSANAVNANNVLNTASIEVRIYDV